MNKSRLSALLVLIAASVAWLLWRRQRVQEDQLASQSIYGRAATPSQDAPPQPSSKVVPTAVPSTVPKNSIRSNGSSPVAMPQVAPKAPVAPMPQVAPKAPVIPMPQVAPKTAEKADPNQAGDSADEELSQADPQQNDTEQVVLAAAGDGELSQADLQQNDTEQVVLAAAEDAATYQNMHYSESSSAGENTAAPAAEGTDATDSEESPRRSQPALLDLNTAREDELVALPGIGPALAQRIIDYRKHSGPFTSIDDLLKVPGIGPNNIHEFDYFLGVEPSEQ